MMAGIICNIVGSLCGPKAGGPNGMANGPSNNVPYGLHNFRLKYIILLKINVLKNIPKW